MLLARFRRLKDVFYMPNENKLYLCFEYCEFDLKKYMKSQQYKLSADCIKSFTYQMLAGLTWCHSHRIFHRCAYTRGSETLHSSGSTFKCPPFCCVRVLQ